MDCSLYRTAASGDAVRAWCEHRLVAWPTAHERSVLDTGLGETHLVVAGHGDTTVLYLPGTNMSAATSLPVLSALAARHRVVAADVPGQPGLSAGVRPGGDRLACYGAWVGELVAHLHADLLVLVGHSLGAAITLAAEPDGVAGLVLVDPAGIVRLRVGASVFAATLPWLLRPTTARSARLVRQLHGPGRHPADDEVEWMTLVARTTRTSAAPGPLPAAVLRRWRATPRAVLSGERDCFLPAPRLRDAVRRHLDVELQVLPGTGHMAPDEQPEAVVAAVDTLGGR
ncbi:Pimeloyl-ACP methyl ester carboxylesterase [Geodermatophilus saharensis]|uniref:Pimeloyl-ACP methyl ester carboxylesterase n=1 Tax=Geodermatophilus saharensis TaxID=1137994 RepID=A0A239DFT0_9ACTN|nr:alpha/beta hydrolase [Geodermatophilus saharensis]SNS30694.1 Pimeloyl-ACP methyl ester carboxylesterase [Geodermatophilus saharensis]